ncbi:MAG TPA: hypothetical protein VEJ20_09440, partial [Candidatus Eremiobacteraceae bacterium]|nr:hypothetical protein [Candidatus Eremiobacteraceae bacterium]
WQALEVLNFRCGLEIHRLGPQTDSVLMRDMPVPIDDRPCHGFSRDSGPGDQVEAVRRLMHGAGLKPWVVVVGDWALAAWYGGGGGEDQFERRGSKWVRVSGGGGEFGASDLRAFGVPDSIVCQFRDEITGCH